MPAQLPKGQSRGPLANYTLRLIHTRFASKKQREEPSEDTPQWQHELFAHYHHCPRQPTPARGFVAAETEVDEKNVKS